MSEQLCPVCQGRGIVPHMFYSIPVQQPTFTSDATTPERCRRCGGTGTIAVSGGNEDGNPIGSNKTTQAPSAIFPGRMASLRQIERIEFERAEIARKRDKLQERLDSSD